MGSDRGFLDVFRNLSRADLVLSAFPPVFIGLYGLGGLIFDSSPIGAAVASIAYCVILLDAFFLHPPRSD